MLYACIALIQVVATDAAAEPTGLAAISQLDAESEHESKWKAEQSARIDALEAEAQKAEADLTTAAQAELAEWEKTYQSGLASRAAANKVTHSLPPLMFQSKHVPL